VPAEQQERRPGAGEDARSGELADDDEPPGAGGERGTGQEGGPGERRPRRLSLEAHHPKGASVTAQYAQASATLHCRRVATPLAPPRGDLEVALRPVPSACGAFGPVCQAAVRALSPTACQVIPRGRRHNPDRLH
jgi:hypothetical protein